MHGRPAASGGRPLPQQGGAAVTGLRAVWGGAHARTGGRNCRTCGETNSPLPARKAERKDTSKMGRYIFRNCSHFFPKHAILTTPLERLRGAARRTGEIRSGSSRAGTGRRTDETVHFPLRSASSSHPPSRRRPEKQAAANRFPVLHLPRAGARTAGAIPAPARTFAAKGGDAYDCPQMKKSLQSHTGQHFCRRRGRLVSQGL